MIRVAPLDEARLGAWAALFEACHQPCYCRWWHFGGTKNDWLARCASAPEENRAEHEAAVRAGDPAACGLVALDGDRVVGWMKLAPRAALPKLRNERVYRAHNLGPDDGVWSVGCFLVHPEHRRAGVARALLAAAADFVRARGGAAIEGYPRGAVGPVHDEQAWMGPEALFAEAGFAPVAGEAPYRVWRRAL